MNEHIKNLQQLINIAIQKGVFQDSNSVIALQNSLNEIIKLINGKSDDINNSSIGN